MQSVSRHFFPASKGQNGLSFLGTRLSAQALREDVDAQIIHTKDDVVIDFADVSISHSFADELVGVLLMRHGPDVLARLVFKHCTDSVKATIEFVVADRYDEYIRTRAH
jgi:hypothetical protein